MNEDRSNKGKAPQGGSKPTPGQATQRRSPGTTVGELILVLFVILLISVVFNFIAGLISGVNIISALSPFVSYLKMLATFISMTAIVIIVYSFMRTAELSSAETKKLGLALNWSTEKKQKNERWERVEQYMTSLNVSDWKIAILEADNMLDDITERMGYKGENLGERMKQIEASDFPYLEEAWQAHKMRNTIAHKGTDYALTRSEAEQTINMYHRIFKDLGYL